MTLLTTVQWKWFGRPVKVDADIYVSDKDDLKAGDLTLTFLHTPGHTPGGMCVYAAGCLFSGDTLFCRSIGRTDFLRRRLQTAYKFNKG